MASKKAFDAMISEDWSNVREIIATTSWTSADLEEQHVWQGYGCTLLIAAVRVGNEDIIHLLLNAGAAIEAKDMLGKYTALHCAVAVGHLKAVEILLDRGADMEARNMMVTLLVDRGANINTRENAGRSVLRWSAESVQVAVVKLLCSKGADIDAQEVKEYMHDIGSWRPTGYSAKKNQIIAAIQAEVEWRRVKNFVVFLHAGGLSVADWSVRRLGGGGSMPATDGTTAAVPDIPSTGFTLSGRQSKVLENRDLCRIVTSYSIPM